MEQTTFSKGAAGSRITESRMVIRFQDCDPLQHLNNSKYFDYFFNARSDQVQQLFGYSPADVFRRYYSGWVAYNHNISYIRPALPGEWVRIYSRLLTFTEDMQFVEYFMTDDESSHIKALLWTTMVYVDVKTGKRIQHQPEITAALQEMLDESHSYEARHFSNPPIYQRLKELKQEVIK